MTFDELQKTWQSQESSFKLSIDSDMLLREVQRNKKHFESAIFWRDVREGGSCIFVSVLFLYIGLKSNLWPFFVAALLSLSVGVFLMVDRIVQKRKRSGSAETLMDCVKSSLAEVIHQIWLLKNVLWWYLLPLAGCIGFIVGCVAWMVRKDIGKGWIFLLGYSVLVILLYWGIYHLNQWAVRKKLVPRKQELELLLNSLANDSRTT
jgi:hypothetical protein